MSRNNRFITDLKWNSKKSLLSMRNKLEKQSMQWDDMDFFLRSKYDELISNIDEIIKEIDGVDAKSH